MASYMSSSASVSVSLPLKKCNHGTILQVSHTLMLVMFPLLQNLKIRDLLMKI